MGCMPILVTQPDDSFYIENDCHELEETISGETLVRHWINSLGLKNAYIDHDLYADLADGIIILNICESQINCDIAIEAVESILGSVLQQKIKGVDLFRGRKKLIIPLMQKLAYYYMLTLHKEKNVEEVLNFANSMGSEVCTLKGFDDENLANGQYLLALIDGVCFTCDLDEDEEDEQENKVDWEQVLQS